MKKNAKPLFYILLSLAIPTVIMVVALIGLRVTPFGDKTLIISDANGLYVNYLGYVGRLVKGLEGFTYSFEKGLGGNMMPHMGGTMSNPVFALVALFQVSDYPQAFTWISVVNFSLCGLTMYLLLADVFGHKRSNLIFSTSYALSGFLVANVFQIIFFTGPQALPLMVLGLRKIFQGKNPLLYILSLAYALATNAYFGFTLCVFSVLLFFAGLWRDREALNGKKLSIFVHYALSSLCGGLLAICVWLPAFMGIMGGRLDQTSITNFSFWENMPFVEIFSKLFTGTNSASQLVDGLPNIFVGLLPVALVVLFFLNKKIDRRSKAAAGFLLGIYLLSFYIVAFDMLMHAGTTTNWFNHRYSFIFSFLLLLIAARQWESVGEIPFPDLKLCLVGLLIAAILVFSRRYEYVMGGEVLLDFALLLLIGLAYWMHRSRPDKNPRRTFELATLVIVCFSLFLNYTISTKNIMEWGIVESDYKQTVDMVWPLVNSVRLSEDGFYRMEVNKQRSESCGNDPMLYGYNGVGHGGSNERNFVREALSKLGVAWFDMRNYYAQGIPAATDALLGIKYLIANEDISQEKDYTRMTDMKAVGLAEEGEETYDLYHSPYALPVTFVAQSDVNGLELDYDDLFDNLNRVWQAVSGSNQSAFVEEDAITFRSHNLSDAVNMDAAEAREIVQKYDKKPVEGEEASASDSESEAEAPEVHIIMDEPPMFSASVEFSFTAAQDGPVYVYHGSVLSKTKGYTESVVKYMGNYHAGDTVKGYLWVNGDYVNRVTFEEYAGRFRAAYADLDALKAMSAAVTARPSTIQKDSGDTHLTGSFTAAANQELLFTIPWDEGWTCYVDGQKAELTKVLGVFMAAQVAPGEHTYEMKYTPAGLSLGLKIAVGTLVFMLIYLLFLRKRLNRWLIRTPDATPKEATPA